MSCRPRRFPVKGVRWCATKSLPHVGRPAVPHCTDSTISKLTCRDTSVAIRWGGTLLCSRIVQSVHGSLTSVATNLTQGPIVTCRARPPLSGGFRRPPSTSFLRRPVAVACIRPALQEQDTQTSWYMASYYGRRNILNLQLPGHYRLYPPSHSEPVFDTGIGQLPSRSRVSAEHEANLQLTRAATRGSTQGSTRGSTQGSTRRSLSQERRRSGDENGDAPRPSHSNPAEGSRRTNDVPILAPPPAYTGAGVPLSRTISSGATLVASGSSGGRKSRVIQVNWRYHPSLTGPHQKRDRLIRYLSRKREILNDQFPEDFMDLLIAGQCSEADINKIEGLYKARIDHLNNWVIPSHLVGTRLCMGLLEVSLNVVSSARLLVIPACPSLRCFWTLKIAISFTDSRLCHRRPVHRCPCCDRREARGRPQPLHVRRDGFVRRTTNLFRCALLLVLASCRASWKEPRWR